MFSRIIERFKVGFRAAFGKQLSDSEVVAVIEHFKQQGRDEVINNFKIHLDMWKAKCVDSMLIPTIESILQDHTRTISSEDK